MPPRSILSYKRNKSTLVRVKAKSKKKHSFMDIPRHMRHLRRSIHRSKRHSSLKQHNPATYHSRSYRRPCASIKNAPKLDKDMLMRVCSIASPSGHETDMIRFLRHYAETHLKNIRVIVESGELYFVRMSPHKQSQTILFDAHIDQVGCRVMRIDDSGFLICRCFGINSTDMNGRVVSILTRKGVIKGVVVIMPPHLNTPNFSDDEMRIDNPAVLVDIFTTTKGESEKIVEVGDVIYLEPSPSIIRNDVIIGAGLDNHVGTYVVFELARYVNELSQKDMVNHMIIHFSCREEVGNLRYVNMLSKYPDLPRNIDLVIVVDTDIATDVPNIPINITSDSRIGNGVILSRNLVDEQIVYQFISDVARKEKIKHQTTMSDGNNGGNNLMRYTNLNVIGQSIGIPLRYMHSDVECVSLQDIACTMTLLSRIFLLWRKEHGEK